MPDDDKESSVRVAVRIRPQIPRELIDMCRVCTQVTPGEPQVFLGSDKAFTFDYVFDMSTTQVSIYNSCIEKLVDGALKGYNATVLAYGQTGSGKTYTMGTGFDRAIPEIQEGIIPRAVRHLFEGITQLQQNPYDEDGTYLGPVTFTVEAQFMELYNEEIIDLLNPYNKGGRVFKIFEDASGGIAVAGATKKPLTGPQEALNCLQQGALARTTASTQMNEQSSRSHALFTILIRRQRVLSPEQCDNIEGDTETLTSKFHFVDLAGSERLKRTGATGERAREGISINCGLLALGNVISALGDKTKKVSHVPYRDSKLTRLLQDSLGGNSQTIMIACVSPSDRDFMETLNTLKYANRARNIKNKVQVNQDQSSRIISQLRREIASLQLEMLEYKQGKRSIDDEGNTAVSDVSLENEILLQDNKRLQQRVKAMQDTIDALTERNASLKAQLRPLPYVSSSVTEDGNMTQSSKKEESSNMTSSGGDSPMQEMVAAYILEIEKLNAKLIESQQMCQQLKKAQTSQSKLRSNFPFLEEETETVINLAKRELEKEREVLMSRSLPGLENEGSLEQESDSNSDTESDDKAEELRAEMLEVNSDIALKSKLIEQLELSQQRLQTMRQQYEEKLNVLNAKITNTQRERDQILANMTGGGLAASNNIKGGNGPNNDAAVKRVKEDFERKLSEMQRELKKLQSAQREHVRKQREMQAQEARLKTLRSELEELKQVRNRLQRKMTEENHRHKEMESRKTREIAKLRKESMKLAGEVKSLQAQGLARDQVLKRKTEEVTNLRRTQRGQLSLKAAGRVNPQRAAGMQSSKSIKVKWEALQRTIMRAARSRQTVVELELELDRVIQERNMLSRDLMNLRQRKKDGAESSLHDLISEEDTIIANLNYFHDTIGNLHNSIIQMEENKDVSSEQEMLQNITNNIASVEEAKFLLQRLCQTTIGHVCEAGLNQARLREREALLNELQQDSSVQEQLLQYILERAPAAATSDASFSSAQSANSYAQSSNSNGVTAQVPDIQQPSSSQQRTHVIDSTTRSPSPSASNTELDTFVTYRNSSKQRRNPAVVPSVATIQDLLYGSSSGYVGPAGNGNSVVSGGGSGISDPPVTYRGSSSTYTNSTPSSQPANGADVAQGGGDGSKLEKVGICIYLEDSGDDDDTKHPSLQERQQQHHHDIMSRSYTVLGGATDAAAAANAGLPTAPPSLPTRTFVPLSRVPSAPGSLKGLQPHQSISRQNSTASPLLARKSFDTSGAPSSPRISRRTFPSKVSPGIEDEVPTSPPVYRRGISREDNGDVFSRLGAGTQDPLPGGNIKELNGKSRAGLPLICTHVVEGHTNSVLSIKVCNDTLFTAAADRTVKVWDLRSSSTPHCLTGHLGPVAAVEYDQTNNLLFSASGAFVKVWDLRNSNVRPIITLCSSGTTLPASASLSDLVPGECSITALTIGASGKLYTAASDKVRFWDLRQFACLGRLSGGHQAAVMCLTAWEGPNSTDLVATGSKDHYVKVFEVNASGGVVQPLLHLEPPHYDGVQALAVANDAIGVDAELFSGSRDSGIKRWDLRNGELKQSLNNAHKGWVSGMAIYGDILLSSCRGGVIRLWNIKTCESLAEMKTEQSINDIVTSDNRVFTASNSGEVRIWRFATNDWDSLGNSLVGSGATSSGNISTTTSTAAAGIAAGSSKLKR